MGLARAHREGTVLGGWAPGERLPPHPRPFLGQSATQQWGLGRNSGTAGLQREGWPQ